MTKPISPLRQRMIDDMTMRNLSVAALRFFYGTTLRRPVILTQRRSQLR